MSQTLIKLSGHLGKTFGREHRFYLDTKTPAEAIRALCATRRGFREYMRKAESRGYTFAVWRGAGDQAENIGMANLQEPAGDTIRIAPIVIGSKQAGILQTVLGVVLIVVGGIITGWSFGAASPVGTAIAGVGLSMVAGGVVQMLSPQPSVGKGGDSSDNQASYVFSGAVNTSAQGNPVPVLYGRMIVGSAVISAGMDAEEYSAATSGVTAGTATGSNKKTPYEDDQ